MSRLFRVTLLIVSTGLLSAASARAQFLKSPVQAAANVQRAELSAELNFTALQPGQQAVVAVVLDIKPGFHAQSHTPSAANYIKLEVKADAAGPIKFFEP